MIEILLMVILLVWVGWLEYPDESGSDTVAGK
jgi:hypothetical protein